MENNTRKYILIPEYKPLWAMQRCFGPTHGPLKEPCPTALDIIGELLRQSGREALTIFEVPNPKERKGDPVKLTLDNYTLPYDEIVAGAVATGMKINQTRTPQEPRRPEAVESDKNTAKAIADMLNGNATSNPAEAVSGLPEAETPSVPEDPVADDPTPGADAVAAEETMEQADGEAVDGTPDEDVVSGADETDGNADASAETADMADEDTGVSDAEDEDDEPDDEAEAEDQPAAQGNTRRMTKAERRAARKAAAKAAEQNNQ